MYLRRSMIWKYALTALAGAALYCEWFVYIIQPWYWQNLECQDHNMSCTKIIFVADPQIQGEAAVPPPLSYLFNWDSDRYLKATFSVVANHFKADIIVFMGDLMDEGSISTPSEYSRYRNRLDSIFELPYSAEFIWIPGDNDIGGENEPVKKEKIELFNKFFSHSSVVSHNNISFYKVNAITYTIPQMPDGTKDDNLRIVISHYPVTIRYAFNQQVSKLHPNIYFCAHEHSSKYVKQDKDFTHREVIPYVYDEKVLDIPMDNRTIYEVYVPTCSYRMGTSKIGYGAAIVENNNQQIRYTVFWSSKRFPILIFYLAALVLTIVYFFIFCTARLFHRRPKKFMPSIEKQPLL